MTHTHTTHTHMEGHVAVLVVEEGALEVDVIFEVLLLDAVTEVERRTGGQDEDPAQHDGLDRVFLSADYGGRGEEMGGEENRARRKEKM